MTVLVVGAGPAGVAAAVGCARGGATVVLLEGLAPGGEAVNVDEVTELPGQPPISGPDFAAALTEQVLAHDIELRLAQVGAMRAVDGVWEVETWSGQIEADVVVYCAVADGRAARQARTGRRPVVRQRPVHLCSLRLTHARGVG